MKRTLMFVKSSFVNWRFWRPAKRGPKPGIRNGGDRTTEPECSPDQSSLSTNPSDNQSVRTLHRRRSADDFAGARQTAGLRTGRWTVLRSNFTRPEV